LTAAEEKAWEHAFSYYLDQKKGQMKADKLAWRDLQKEFPRLKKYDGAAA
jgi:hypothetical protein